MEIQKVSSLEEFLIWAKSVVSNSYGDVPRANFYRGHCDANFELIPSIYRTNENGETYRASEYGMYQDMLHREPLAFGSDKTTFEKLVRMQHHGLPTRLLDLTLNPLVALYFACNEEYGVDGEVIYTSIPQNTVIYSSSVPAQSLAGLDVNLDYEKIIMSTADIFMDRLLNLKKRFIIDHTYASELISKFLDSIKIEYDKIRAERDYGYLAVFISFVEGRFNLFVKTEVLKFHDELNGVLSGDLRMVINKAIDSYNNIIYHVNELSSDLMGQYCNVLQIKKSISWCSVGEFMAAFMHYLFVCAPLGNERIRRQQGAFLLFPPIISGSNNVINFCQAPTHCYSSVVVDGTCKRKIIDDLDDLGISRGYLFPELENQAANIKRKYSRKA